MWRRLYLRTPWGRRRTLKRLLWVLQEERSGLSACLLRGFHRLSGPGGACDRCCFSPSGFDWTRLASSPAGFVYEPPLTLQ